MVSIQPRPAACKPGLAGETGGAGRGPGRAALLLVLSCLALTACWAALLALRSGVGGVASPNNTPCMYCRAGGGLQLPGGRPGLEQGLHLHRGLPLPLPTAHHPLSQVRRLCKPLSQIKLYTVPDKLIAFAIIKAMISFKLGVLAFTSLWL